MKWILILLLLYGCAQVHVVCIDDNEDITVVRQERK